MFIDSTNPQIININKKVILGIDPGVHNLGWAILTQHPHNNQPKYIASGVILNKPNLHITDKLAHILIQLDQIIAEYKITMIATETAFLEKDLRALLSLSYARAIVMAISGKHKIPFFDINAIHIKKNVAGSGKASKEQIKFMIAKLLSITEPKNEHESDALAVAYCHFVDNATLNLQNRVNQ
ncbi:MAG: crossover junction endodeoxyribonuclease RuvC [Rickettsiaceae bacterium]|nr:crossover junction endodeoxyribonuclease RuvC [Rickettsiaceae bacterium]